MSNSARCPVVAWSVGPVDARLTRAPVVGRFAWALSREVDVVGLYAAGSLASGDFQPGVSDLDLIAVVATAPDAGRRKALSDLHQRMVRDERAAAKLHCLYAVREQLDDVRVKHLTWAHGQLYRRPLSAIARAELLNGGLTVLGPPPATVLAPVSLLAVQAAARDELRYWRGVTRRPWLWLDDAYVDLGLVTLARAEAVLTQGRLITKSQALSRLDRFAVPRDLIREVTDRRRGTSPPARPWQRVRRAALARRIVAHGVRSLTRS